MDVYFRPFIRPKNPARDVRTPPEKQGCADFDRRVTTRRLSVCLEWLISAIWHPAGRAANTHWLALFILSHSPKGAWLWVDTLSPTCEAGRGALPSPPPHTDNLSRSSWRGLRLTLFNKAGKWGPSHYNQNLPNLQISAKNRKKSDTVDACQVMWSSL